MFELFAWSSSGHLMITQAAVLLAVTAIKTKASASLMDRLRKVYYRLASKQVGLIDTPAAVKENLKKQAGGRVVGKVPHEDVSDFGQSMAKDGDASWRELGLAMYAKTDEDKLKFLLYRLPFSVVKVDLHVGNLPKVGEFFDPNGQVRHFMRSTDGVSSEAAFKKSMEWIQTKSAEARAAFRKAFDKAGELIDVFNATASNHEDGISLLADALHTLEDSFAQGHVRRASGNTNLIREVNRWDEANKDGDPTTGRLGHHAYDDPHNEQNKEYVAACIAVAAELIELVFLNIDQPDANFVQTYANFASRRFVFFPDANDYVPFSKNRG